MRRLERALFGRWMQWLTNGGSDASNKAMFVEALDIMDEELTKRGGPYFLGEEFSLVDITFTPFLERMVARCVTVNNLM
jgi:glutathione S-transferase